MNLNEKFVITINRELGSGGRTVGRKLAEKLDVPFYDKALIKALEKKYHLTVEEIERLKGRDHGWWADFKRVVSIGKSVSDEIYYQVEIGEEPDLLTTDEMFKAEREILKGIAEDESCVIAGRSGFHVFRNHPNHLSVLIQMRENYVKKYTKSSRYDTRNYDLVISADGKTEDEITDLILRYIG